MKPKGRKKKARAPGPKFARQKHLPRDVSDVLAALTEDRADREMLHTPMTVETRAKLEKAGYRVGSAEDFLSGKCAPRKRNKAK